MKPLKIGAYIRVSTDEQAKLHEGSLDSQKFRIQEFVKFKNSQQKSWGDIVEFYVEDGVSAGTTNRPMYQKMMNDVRKGKVNLILVSDLTRLSRNLLDFCNLINELEEYKASYLSMKEQFDTSTPIGRMMVYVIIALGQFEREQTSERVSVNCHSRAVRGLLNGGVAPLGYDKNADKKGILEINEKEAEAVRMIFNLYLEQGSKNRTVEVLNERGVRPKRTSLKSKSLPPAKWNIGSLGKLLEQPAYIGLREVNKIYKNEDQSSLKPFQRYQMVKASWPAIVEEKVFYEVQKRLEDAKEYERTRLAHKEDRVFLLTGLLHCGITGKRLVGSTGHSSSGLRHRYYHYGKSSGEFKRPRLHAQEIEEKLINTLKTALLEASYFKNLEAEITKADESNGKHVEKEIQRTKKELESVNARFTQTLNSQSQMQLNPETLKFISDELNKLADSRSKLEEYLTKLKSKADVSASAFEKVLYVENQIRALVNGWEKSPVMQKKRLLRKVIKSIIATEDRLKITYWTSAEEQFGSEVLSEKNIVKISKFSVEANDHNSLASCSGIGRIGSERRT